MRWLVVVPLAVCLVSFGGFVDPGSTEPGVVACLATVAATALAIVAARGPRAIWIAGCLVGGSVAAGFAAIAADRGLGFLPLVPLFPLAMGAATHTWRSPNPPRMGAVRATLLWAAMGAAAGIALGVAEGWLATNGIPASGNGILFAPVGVVIGASIEAGRRRWYLLAAVVVAATAVAAVDGVTTCHVVADCLADRSLDIGLFVVHADGLLLALAFSAVSAMVGAALGVLVRAPVPDDVGHDPLTTMGPLRF